MCKAVLNNEFLSSLWKIAFRMSGVIAFVQVKIDGQLRNCEFWKTKNKKKGIKYITTVFDTYQENKRKKKMKKKKFNFTKLTVLGDIQFLTYVILTPNGIYVVGIYIMFCEA